MLICDIKVKFESQPKTPILFQVECSLAALINYRLKVFHMLYV